MRLHTYTRRAGEALTASAIGNGGDIFSPYARVFWEVAQPDSGIGLRPGALPVLINFGDTVPHDCNLSETGCTAIGATGGDPGRDGMLGTSDDVDFHDGALPALQAAGVKVIQVYTGGTNRVCHWTSLMNKAGGVLAILSATMPDLDLVLPDLVLAACDTVDDVRLEVDADCPMSVVFVADAAGPYVLHPVDGADVSGQQTVTVHADADLSSDLVCEVRTMVGSVVYGRQDVVIPAVVPAPSGDTTPPVIVSATADPDELWPPNLRLHPIDLAVVLTDDQDPAPTWRIVSVASNQRVLFPRWFPDWVIREPHDVSLRAAHFWGWERAYTITIEAADASGNTSTATVRVTVPLPERRRGWWCW